MAWVRLAAAWATVVAFLMFGGTLFVAATSALALAGLFAWLLGIIMWSAFGVVHEADEIAEILGEPYGTLVLTLTIVLIEVALISAVMLGAAEPTLGRDTMFAVLMIVLNGVVGLGLLFGGWRYGEQEYNPQGANAFLSIIVPLATVALILPNFTRSTAGGTLSVGQAIAFAIFTVLLYATFLLLQTGRHRDFFVAPEEAIEPVEKEGREARHTALPHAALLVASVIPVVLLAKQLAKVLGTTITALGAPPALGGVVIALVVFTPEGLASLRAISLNKLQRTINLCLGAAASTIGLTVPAVLLISLVTKQDIVLGLQPAEMVLLVLTLAMNILTFSSPRTTALSGAMHLMVFFVYLTLIFNP